MFLNYNINVIRGQALNVTLGAFVLTAQDYYNLATPRDLIIYVVENTGFKQTLQTYKRSTGEITPITVNDSGILFSSSIILSVSAQKTAQLPVWVPEPQDVGTTMADKTKLLWTFSIIYPSGQQQDVGGGQFIVRNP